MHLIEEIGRVESDRIQEILEAVMQRYDALFPNCEVNFFSIPKSADRNTHIDNIIRMLRSYKTYPDSPT